MKIKAGNVEATAYLALPNKRPGKAVLVLHPWWGLNDDMKTICDRLAQAGYVTLAPDLYNGRLATTVAQAEKLSETVDEDSAMKIVQAAAGVLLRHEACGGNQMGVIGFSMGASFAVSIAHHNPNQVRAVVLFYGLGWAEQTNTQASYLGHFAKNDPYEDDEYRDHFEEKLKENGRSSTFHIYPNTSHWFFEPGVPDAYAPAAAELAWERTLAFLEETLS